MLVEIHVHTKPLEVIMAAKGLEGRNKETVDMMTRRKNWQKFATLLVNFGVALLVLGIPSYGVFKSYNLNSIKRTALIAQHDKKDSVTQKEAESSVSTKQTVPPVKKNESLKVKSAAKPLKSVAVAVVPQKTDSQEKVSAIDPRVIDQLERQFNQDIDMPKENLIGKIKRFFRDRVKHSQIEDTYAANRGVTPGVGQKPETAEVNKAFATTFAEINRRADSSVKASKVKAHDPQPVQALTLPDDLGQLEKYYPSVFDNKLNKTTKDKCYALLKFTRSTKDKLERLRASKIVPASEFTLESNLAMDMRRMVNSPACRVHFENFKDGTDNKLAYAAMRDY